MDWVDLEMFRLNCLLFTDELIGGQALECFESSREVVGSDQTGQMLFNKREGVRPDQRDPMWQMLTGLGSARWNARSLSKCK